MQVRCDFSIVSHVLPGLQAHWTYLLAQRQHQTVRFMLRSGCMLFVQWSLLKDILADEPLQQDV